MRLPNANQVIVDIRKLKDYCLEPLHPRGKHKARVFERALNLTQRNAEELREEILRRVPYEEALLGEGDDYGKRYVVDSSIFAEAAGREFEPVGFSEQARRPHG